MRPAALREALGVRPGTVSHVAWTTGDLGAEREHMAGAGCGLLTTSAGGAVADWFGAPLFGHPVEIHQPAGPVLDFWAIGQGRGLRALPPTGTRSSC